MRPVGRPVQPTQHPAFAHDRIPFPIERIGRRFHRRLKDALRSRALSSSFLKDLQTTMNGRPPPPTRHNSAPAPSTLPEELLLARFVLVRRDDAQPPLSRIYNGPYRVLERSTHFFLLEMGERTDKVSTLCLKAARTPADTETAKPRRRGRPVEQAPPVRGPPPKQWGRL